MTAKSAPYPTRNVARLVELKYQNKRLRFSRKSNVTLAAEKNLLGFFYHFIENHSLFALAGLAFGLVVNYSEKGTNNIPIVNVLSIHCGSFKKSITL
jgi:hypothetical protein